MRYELTDHEWAGIKPMLPNKPRGVPRVNDRRVLNGICWVLRAEAPWRDLPKGFGPYISWTSGTPTLTRQIGRWPKSRVHSVLEPSHTARRPNVNAIIAERPATSSIH